MITDPFMGEVSMFWSYYTPNDCCGLTEQDRDLDRAEVELPAEDSKSRDAGSSRGTRSANVQQANGDGGQQMIPACYIEAMLMLC